MKFLGCISGHDFSVYCSKLESYIDAKPRRYRYFRKCIRCEKEDKKSEFYHDSHDFNILSAQIKRPVG